MSEINWILANFYWLCSPFQFSQIRTVLKRELLWKWTQYRLGDYCSYFEGTWWLHPSGLMSKILLFYPEDGASMNQTIEHHILGENNVHSHHYEDINPHGSIPHFREREEMGEISTLSGLQVGLPSCSGPAALPGGETEYESLHILSNWRSRINYFWKIVILYKTSYWKNYWSPTFLSLHTEYLIWRRPQRKFCIQQFF